MFCQLIVLWCINCLCFSTYSFHFCLFFLALFLFVCVMFYLIWMPCPCIGLELWLVWYTGNEWEDGVRLGLFKLLEQCVFTWFWTQRSYPTPSPPTGCLLLELCHWSVLATLVCWTNLCVGDTLKAPFLHFRVTHLTQACMDHDDGVLWDIRMYYVVIFRLSGDTFIFRLLGNTFIFKFNPALHGGAVAVNGTENLKTAHLLFHRMVMIIMNTNQSRLSDLNRSHRPWQTDQVFSRQPCRNGIWNYHVVILSVHISICPKVEETKLKTKFALTLYATKTKWMAPSVSTSSQYQALQQMWIRLAVCL